MKRWLTIILNLVAFDVCWAAAMLSAAKPWWWIGPALIALSAAGQLLLRPAPLLLAAVLVGGSAVGVLTDLLAASLGLFAFNGGQGRFALVFFALWLNFGTTLTPSLRFLWRRPLAAALLGGFGGPLAYLAGHELGAITLADDRLPTLAWVAAQYALLTPLWMRAAERFVPAEAPRAIAPGATR